MDKERLVLEIRFELDQLRKLAELVGEFQTSIGNDVLPWHAAAGAKYVADLWNGFENLCKRRCRYLRIPVASGADWHSRMLDEFINDQKLGGMLSKEIQYRLKKYKSFRHRFVHGYGHEIDWRRVEEPLRLLPETVNILSDTWLGWLNTLT